jgi:hypothetical protein
MDDVVNRLARALSGAIAAAVADDSRVEACRERALAAGYELKLSLEAVIGFVNRTAPEVLATISPAQTVACVEGPSLEMSATDRRFLRALRIAADETQPNEVE